MPDIKPVMCDGDVVKLKGPPDGQVVDEPYLVVAVVNREALRVKDTKGVIFRVHKSRVAEVIKQTAEQKAQAEAQKPVKKETKEPKAEAQKPKQESREARRTTMATKPEKKEPKEKKAKKEVKSKIIPFDVNAWAKAHGGVLLSKGGKFDHTTHKLHTFLAVDEKGGYYYFINAYRYPNNVLGGANGESKYPLKGQRVSLKIETKAGGHSTRVLKGTKDAAQVIAEREKKGFKHQEIKESAAPAPAPTPAPEAPAPAPAPAEPATATA